MSDGHEDRWYANLDPVLGSVVRRLTELAEQIEEQILVGRMQSYEQYLAQVQTRHIYVNMIAEIRETLADDRHHPDQT